MTALRSPRRVASSSRRALATFGRSRCSTPTAFGGTCSPRTDRKDPETVKRGATLAEEVRSVRDALGLTQERLAEKLGTTTSTINRIERGHIRPSARTLRALRAL